jgi:phosphatidate cytidylyltransferase
MQRIKKRKETLLAQQPFSKKVKNFVTRIVWGLLMLVGFICILWAGPIAVILFVLCIQTKVYAEVISLGIIPSKERKLPWFRSVHWHLLISTTYFLYGESVIYYYKPIVFVDAFLTPLATHHRFISFWLYIAGFVTFVVNLKKGNYKFQLAQFSWTHMALLLVVVQAHFVINNIFEGLIWFVLPVLLVIANDSFAYFFGFFFGRTQLIDLSPKKTWEGFIGGFFSTMIIAFFISGYLVQFPQMIVPLQCQTTGTSCIKNDVFILREYDVSPMITAFIKHLTSTLHAVYPPIQTTILKSIVVYPIQLHAFILAAFASLIAPFGGFFASGVKRAFKIKDFGDSIPGHGGLTDRMDCQFIMGVFSFMYFNSFISHGMSNVGTVLQNIVAMEPDKILEIYNKLGEYLEGQGMLA